MAKVKEKGGAVPVPKAVDVTGGAGAVPAMDSVNGAVFQLYGSVLASIDWQRDLRKHPTICRDAFKIAVLAYEVFQENIKNKELT